MKASVWEEVGGRGERRKGRKEGEEGEKGRVEMTFSRHLTRR